MLRLSPTSMAHLGEAVARLDGKAHFIAGAMPGETVLGRVTLDKGAWARVALQRIEKPSADRLEPPCAHFPDCGGCQWQFASYQRQLEWKRDVVVGQLRHLGRIADPDVRAVATTGRTYGYRNRMDFGVTGGRPALHRSRSRELVPLDTCLLLHPVLADLFVRLGPLDGARGITLRVAEATGETLAVVEGSVPEGASTWEASVAQKTRSGLRAVRGSVEIHEEVRGRAFRITGGSFFQTNTTAAGLLVDLVAEALAPRPGETLLDAYAGVGLFGATVVPESGRVLAVETSPTAVRDLRNNLRRAGVSDASIIRGRVEDTVPRLDEYWQLAVVDPPRRGLGREGVAAVTAAAPRAIAYVSCDPASLARDTRYLGTAGYELDWAAPVDLFPQTFHVETVARYVRDGEA